MSSLPRRVGIVCAVVVTTVCLAAVPAEAAPETSVREGAQAEALAQAIKVQEQLRERQQTLLALNRRADARERALLGRKRPQG